MLGNTAISNGTMNASSTRVVVQPAHGDQGFGAGYETPQHMMSPNATPRPSISSPEGSVYFSPSAPRSSHMTEPRNYAPRTTGQAASQGPPPKFNMDLVTHRLQDVIQSDQLAVQPIQPQALDPAQGLAHRQVQITPASPSEELRRLTDTVTGLPSLTTAIDPANFPFVESGKQARPVNHGIVRLRNVSLFEVDIYILKQCS